MTRDSFTSLGTPSPSQPSSRAPLAPPCRPARTFCTRGRDVGGAANPQRVRIPVRYSSRSEGPMMATPLALATPTLIGAPLAVSSPNAL
jgi:hypothetical protein